MQAKANDGAAAEPATLGRKALRYGAIGTGIWFSLMAYVGVISWIDVSKGVDLRFPKDPNAFSPSFFTCWVSGESGKRFYPPSELQSEDIRDQKRREFLKLIEEGNLHPTFDWGDYCAVVALPSAYWLFLPLMLVVADSAGNRTGLIVLASLAFIAGGGSVVGLIVAGFPENVFAPATPLELAKCVMLIFIIFCMLLVGVVLFAVGDSELPKGRLVIGPGLILLFVSLRYWYLVLIYWFRFLGL